LNAPPCWEFSSFEYAAVRSFVEGRRELNDGLALHRELTCGPAAATVRESVVPLGRRFA